MVFFIPISMTSDMQGHSLSILGMDMGCQDDHLDAHLEHDDHIHMAPFMAPYWGQIWGHSGPHYLGIPDGVHALPLPLMPCI